MGWRQERAPVCLRYKAIVSLLWLGVLLTEVSGEQHSGLPEALHRIPHFKFVGYDNHAVFKPHWGYYQSLVITGLPIVMIGVMYFIIGTAFFRGWLVCWRKEKQTRPTETNRRWLQQLLLVSVILLFAISSVSIWASILFHNSLPDVMDTVSSSLDVVLKRADVVKLDIVPLSHQFLTNTSDFNGVVEEMKDYQNRGEDYKSSWEKVELSRHIATISVFVGVMVVSLLVLHGSCFRWPLPSMLGVIGLWVLILLMWVVCALYLSVSVLAADVCETLDEYLKKEWFTNTTTAMTTVQHYLFCTDIPPALAALGQEAQNISVLANNSMHKAEAAGQNKTAKYWKDVELAAELLYRDFTFMLECGKTSDMYRDIKDTMCTDSVLGIFLLALMSFFVCLFGMGVMVLGWREWHNARRFRSEIGSSYAILMTSESDEDSLEYIDDNMVVVVKPTTLARVVKDS